MTDFNNLWRISADELINTIDNHVILDCRFSLADANEGRSLYNESHIVNAQYFDLESDGCAEDVKPNENGCYLGGKHPLPDLDTLAERFANLGINQDTPVVVYDTAAPMFAARVWWMLRLLGNDHAKILDGGITAFQKQGGEVTDITPSVMPTLWLATPRTEWIISRQQIIDGVDALVDARARDRFNGQNETLHPKAGHIDGAINAPFTEHFDQGLLTDKGPTWPDGATHQCGSGVTACVNLWVDALRGRTELPLYVGSWSDWCYYLDTMR